MATTHPSRPLARREYAIGDGTFRAICTDTPLDGTPPSVTLRIVGPATVQNYPLHFDDDRQALGYLAGILSPRLAVTVEELLAGRIER